MWPIEPLKALPSSEKLYGSFSGFIPAPTGA